MDVDLLDKLGDALDDEDEITNDEEEEFKEPAMTLDMVKLISKEGTTFYIDRKIAMVSEYLENVFSNKFFSDSVSNSITFPDIRTPVLSIIVDFIFFKNKYGDHPEIMPKFQITDDLVIETYVACDYLKL